MEERNDSSIERQKASPHGDDCSWHLHNIYRKRRTDYQITKPTVSSVQFSSVAQSCLTLRPHESQHTRPPCPSPTPGVHSDSCPSSWWCHPAISSSVVPFSSCPQSLPASGLEYNKYMKGVDCSAQYLVNFNILQKTWKWHKKWVSIWVIAVYSMCLKFIVDLML